MRLFPLALAWLLAAAAPLSNPQIDALSPDSAPDLAPVFEHLIETHHAEQMTLHSAGGQSLAVELDATSQGNGTLQVANLLLRVYDTHLETMLYDGGALQVRLADLNAPDPSLIVFGHVLKFNVGNDNPEKPDAAEDVLFVYGLECPSGRLVNRFRSASFDIALQSNLPTRLPCRRR